MKTHALFLLAAIGLLASCSSEIDITEDVTQIADAEEQTKAPSNYNIKGRVVDNAGNPLSGVVVSDGTQCVLTESNGYFYMNSDISKVTFVHVSTPTGYLPKMQSGAPVHYKRISSITPSGGVYNFGKFTFNPIPSSKANKLTIFFTADPQPRNKTSTWDKFAYYSTRCCEALYRDIKETANAMSDRQVIGICLGDLAHEDMTLMGTYADAIKQFGFPTFNIIGNHDNDYSKTTDDGCAWKFEELFGPRNFSFNYGGVHVVMLDNLIMDANGLKTYSQGLTDEIWTWLQADMAYIPKNTKVMVCAHSPMFKLENGNERSNTANHGPDYGALFDQYSEVHAWAGHTHTTFNYNYPTNHRHKKVQVHTLARSTGDLWTNEYLADGTPRGFTIVDIENGQIKWRFHPTKYLHSNFHGTQGQPSYTYRDWNYVDDGQSHLKAVMKGTGNDLDESYQMHVYAPGAYGSGNKYVFANIFLWDDKWSTPTFTRTGGSPVAMEHIQAFNNSTATEFSHDAADTEIKLFYSDPGRYPQLDNSNYGQHLGLHTIFRVQDTRAHDSGIVSVTDRFGNTYTRSISW